MATPRREPEPEPQGSDQSLIRRVVDGDEAALAALYDRYSGVVYSVASRILRDSGGAEEVLQDIFFQLWRTASQFDFARGSLAGWLLVAARHRAIDRLRRRGAAGASPQARQAGQFAPEDPPGEPVSVGLDLESHAARAEAMSKVSNALGGLPENQRQALELAYFEGLTHIEIANRTGEPLGTVKTRLRSAVQSLKRALNPEKS